MIEEPTKERIKARIREKMDNIITRRISALPTDMRSINNTNPFGSRLVPEEIWKGSKFERSFVTSFGQGVYEQIAYEIAVGSGGYAENQHLETVTLNTWQDEAINDLLSAQRSATTPQQTDWNRELQEIIDLDNPRHVDLETRFDLYVRRTDGSEEYYSLKTVKPNLDQIEIAKRDMLRIGAAKPSCKTYLALPYNPDGEGNPYQWSIPRKLFDMNNCPAVLIGGSFWNAVGHNDTVFSNLLEIFHELGAEYRSRIKRDYLGLL